MNHYSKLALISLRFIYAIYNFFSAFKFQHNYNKLILKNQRDLSKKDIQISLIFLFFFKAHELPFKELWLGSSDL